MKKFIFCVSMLASIASFGAISGTTIIQGTGGASGTNFAGIVVTNNATVGTLNVGTNLIVTTGSTRIQNGSADTMVVTNGNVGIGTAVPSTTLAVNGTLSVSNNATFTGSVTASNFVGDGSLLTSTNIGPNNSQVASAGWVRSLLAGQGVSYYNSSVLAVGFTNADQANGTNFTFLQDTIPAYATRVYVNPANNTYFGSVTTTNRFLQLSASVTVNAYLSVDSGGSGTAGPSVKPEIYIAYQTNGPWIGDWDGASQNVPEGGTNLYSWVISNPLYTSTNAAGFYVQRRFKMVTQPTPSASTITFHLGTNFPSHITLAADSGTAGNAYLAAHQTFTGSNVFNGGAYMDNVICNYFTATNAQFDNLNMDTLYATNMTVTALTNSGTTVLQGTILGTSETASNVILGFTYFGNEISASNVTDRSASPANITEALAIVNSIETKNGKVDHAKLSPLAYGNKLVTIMVKQTNSYPASTNVYWLNTNGLPSFPGNTNGVLTTNVVAARTDVVDVPTNVSVPDPTTRSLSMMASANTMVLQDLLRRVAKLEEDNAKLVERLEKLEKK